MNLNNLDEDTFKKKIKQGLNIQIGCFCVNIKTSISEVISNIYFLYSNHHCITEDAFVDFHVSINAPKSIRRWFRPQAYFEIDGYQPIEPLPLAHAYPLFEWGLNWCIANRAHQYLIFHAAIIEKEGKAILMPGVPGAGKSTFCAALVHDGWSLISDELALVDVLDGKVHPMPKPISLKNESIEVISSLYSDAAFGNIYHNTSKGTLTHLRASNASGRISTIKWVLFPRYDKKSSTRLIDENKGRAHIELLNNAFNSNVFGLQGFDAINKILEHSRVVRLAYSDILNAVKAVNRLTERSKNV